MYAATKDAGENPWRSVFSALFFSVSSIGMLLINKCAFTGSSFNAGIIFFQNIVTSFLAISICSLSSTFRFEPTWYKLKMWIPCIFFSLGNIMFSASALSLISIPTFSIFRNSLSLLIAALEFLLLQKQISIPQGFVIMLLIIASLVYGWNDMQFSYWGYMFAVLHVFCLALYSISVKKLSIQFSSSLEMSIYNNAGSLPFLFAMAIYEYQSTATAISIQSKGCAAASVPASVLVSCSGLMSQRMFSATSLTALANFNKLPLLLLSYIFFSDAYSWGQAVGLAVSVAASMGHSCSLSNGPTQEHLCEFPLHFAVCSYRKLWRLATLFILLCVFGFSIISNKLNVFHSLNSSAASHRMEQFDRSLSSCFQLASMCYGNWTKDASLIPIDHTFTNFAWFIESDVSYLSPSSSRGRTALQNVLVGLHHALSERPSRHLFIHKYENDVATEIIHLSHLFNGIGVSDYEISSLSFSEREAMTRMLVADVVVGCVGSLVDIVSQFSANPFVIQILCHHDNSVLAVVLDDNRNASLLYFVGSWMDTAAIPAGISSSQISDKMSAHLAASNPLKFTSSTKNILCDEHHVFDSCKKYFLIEQKGKSCFWGVRSRHEDTSIQLAQLVAFIKMSLMDSLEFVYEPFFPASTLIGQSSEYSWFDNYFGISRLMGVLQVSTVRANGQLHSAWRRCSKLIRLPYHQIMLSAKRDPNKYAEHLCPQCVFKVVDFVNLPYISSETSSSTHFWGHKLRGTAASRIKPLSCSGLDSIVPQNSNRFFPGWPQSRLSESVTSAKSICYNQHSYRRCHDVHANFGDGISLRACQWRMPYGPCETLNRDHRDQLVAVTKGHVFLDHYPLVQLSMRTTIFGAPPIFSGPTICSRADEIIACARVDGLRGQSFLDTVWGIPNPVSAQGSIWHLRDSPGAHSWPESLQGMGITPQFAYNMESPQHEEVVGSIQSARFNFKIDYQLDSEVVSAYFGYSENLIRTIDKKQGIFKPPLSFEDRHKDIHAAWIAKNCKSSSNREQVVHSIMNAGIRVDSFGGCMHNKDFPNGYIDSEENLIKVISRYKFYLSFENSLCRHYYTEKLFRCFEAGVIPILLGHPADVEYFLPHQDAAIKVWEFPNIQALASYILKVASDRDLFFKHIAWKNMSKEHLSPRFLGYWGQVPASGDQGCQTCFMAYDTHIARCVVPHHERHRITLPTVKLDRFCVFYSIYMHHVTLSPAHASTSKNCSVTTGQNTRRRKSSRLERFGALE